MDQPAILLKNFTIFRQFVRDTTGMGNKAIYMAKRDGFPTRTRSSAVNQQIGQDCSSVISTFYHPWQTAY